MKSVGIIGTAKNTGKTTTLSALLRSLKNRKIAVTGIGYDGEEIDNITMLPKPRLYFEKGIIVATAAKCILNAEVEYKILKKTSIPTPLGNVFLVEITKPGLVVIAGPNRVSHLKELMKLIAGLGIDLLLVDGSLNRISPMYLLDELIFTTGGSKNTDIKILTDEMVTVEKIFSLPSAAISPDSVSSISFVSGSDFIPCDLATFIDDDDLGILKKCIPDRCEKIIIPLFFSEYALTGLVQFLKSRGSSVAVNEIVLLSPVHLLLSSDFLRLDSLLRLLSNSGIKFSYVFTPRLEAITINPFFPKLYNYHFVAGYLDKDEFLRSMKGKLSIDVFNVKERFDFDF